MVDDRGGSRGGGPAAAGTQTPGVGLARDAVDALAAIVESSDDAIYSKDANAVITSWNGAAERLYGYTADEIIGRHIEVLIPDSKKGEELDILSQILRGQRVHHYKTQRVRKNGDLVDVSIAVSPVHDSEGRVVQAAVIARNITDQLRLEGVLADERNTQAKIDRKRALELNDEVVQALAVAKMAFETGQHEKGLRAVTSALERAKAVVAGLLAQHGQEAPIEAGDLVRDLRIEDAD